MAVAVEEEVLVDLVGEDEEVVLEGDVGDGFALGLCEDFAGWIGWRVDDDGSGARRDCTSGERRDRAASQAV